MTSELTTKGEPISDPDWKTVCQVSKVKVFVDHDGKLESIASGPRHIGRRNRIVIQGTMGKVLLYCSIPNGGTITIDDNDDDNQ